MKKLINITVFLFVIIVNAQTKDELLEITAKETCECVNELNLDQMSKAKIESMLGVCLLKNYKKHKEEFKGVWVEFTTENATSIAESVGLKMATICPEVFLHFVEDELKEEKLLMIGDLIKVTGDDLSFIHILDENGKNQKFIWFGHFKGSNRFIENPESIKKVKVHYKNIEYFVPKMKEYFTVKEVVEVEFL